jgi:hypothetical protein
MVRWGSEHEVDLALYVRDALALLRLRPTAHRQVDLSLPELIAGMALGCL